MGSHPLTLAGVLEFVCRGLNIQIGYLSELETFINYMFGVTYLPHWKIPSKFRSAAVSDTVLKINVLLLAEKNCWQSGLLWHASRT